MPNSNASSSPPYSAFNWRTRSDHLFAQAGAEAHPIRREALRRKATAALNIAESMERAHEAENEDSQRPAAPLTT